MNVPLNFDRQSGARFEREKIEDTVTISDVIEQLSGFIRRQFPIFVFITACCIAVGLVYLFTTPPSFTSNAKLLIDSSKLRVLQQQDTPVSDVPIDTGQVETQVEILKSESIGLAVVKQMKLSEDNEFIGPGRGIEGLIGRIGNLFSSSKVNSESKATRTALEAFLLKRAITRVARTYVLDIGFTSYSAERSAEVANAIADAYIDDQLAAKYQATRRASGWLQDRIKELRRQASDADRAILDYKEKNKIVAVGGPANSSRLLGEQQIEELNTQLGKARAQAEDAKAKLERITAVMKNDVPDATVTDSLKNEVINRLRNQYLDLSAKEAIWSARYGANHLATVNLRTQMTELRRSILDEFGRIAQGYNSDYAIAKTQVEGLEKSLENLVTNSQTVNRDRLGLRDLESTAQVYQKLYDTFLQRYMEAIQQQSFPITEARVISSAAPPDRKSGPKTFIVLGIAAFAGILLSFGVAVTREAIDQVFRTPRQIELALQMNCLAVLPRLVSVSTKRSGKGLASARQRLGAVKLEKNSASETSPKASDLVASTRDGAKTAAMPAANLQRGGKKLHSSNREFLRQVVEEPLSGFAEAFRSIKIAADIGLSNKSHRVIAVTSTVPGEGKSTVAANLAELIAHSGKRAILVDADLRNPTLTRAMASDADVGLLELLSNQATLSDVICVDEETGLHFVPTLLKTRNAHTNEVLASDLFKSFIDDLRTRYDYIIIDLSPLAPVVDVRATTKFVDSYIYVVEWGKTRKNFVQQQFYGAPELADLMLGVVLNKADIRVLGRYEDYYGSYHNRQYYGRYGYSA